MRKPEGVCLRSCAFWRLRGIGRSASSPRARPRAPSMPSMCAPTPPAIDLTDVLERQRTETDRIQVSTAPGPDGIVRRIEVRAREVEHQLGGVRALQ